MRQVTAHNIHSVVKRALFRQRVAAVSAMARFDPKSIERSTIIGISLFAASSIALQGFVVAQGNLSGKSTGVAQAAIALPDIDAISAVAAPAQRVALRNGIDVGADPGMRRGDRLTDLTLSQIPEDNSLLKVASQVPAHTVIPKNVMANDNGLRTSTFAPTRIYGRSGMNGMMLSSRRMQTVDSDLPRPTRVAFAGAANNLGYVVKRDRGEVIDAAPSKIARAPASVFGQSNRVRRDIIQKVHFQDDTPDRCLPTELMNVIYDVAEKYGDVQILSTFRDPMRNRRVGGAPRSFHLQCQAIDFRVMGPRRDGLLEFLEARADVGGLKRYPLGFFHIDTGPRRTW